MNEDASRWHFLRHMEQQLRCDEDSVSATPMSQWSDPNACYASEFLRGSEPFSYVNTEDNAIKGAKDISANILDYEDGLSIFGVVLQEECAQFACLNAVIQYKTHRQFLARAMAKILYIFYSSSINSSVNQYI